MNAQQRQRFQRGSGTYKCESCGRMTRETGHSESNCKLCAYCFEVAGWENSLQDDLCTQEEFDAAVEDLKIRYKRADAKPVQKAEPKQVPEVVPETKPADAVDDIWVPVEQLAMTSKQVGVIATLPKRLYDAAGMSPDEPWLHLRIRVAAMLDGIVAVSARFTKDGTELDTPRFMLRLGRGGAVTAQVAKGNRVIERRCLKASDRIPAFE